MAKKSSNTNQSAPTYRTFFIKKCLVCRQKGCHSHKKNLASTTTNLLRAVRFVVMYFMRHVMGPETNSNCFISDCFDRENKHEIAFFDPNNISFSFTFALLI